jgi:Helix-turn-helix domain
MTNIFLPQEEDFKKWIRESIREELQKPGGQPPNTAPEEPLLSRQQIAAELGISLVTLTDWMKKGLPYLRLNGRVYFKRSEVIASMKHNVLKRN